MSAHFVITMPQLSDTMAEGVIVSWEKQPGDRVARGDIVATVETDKAIMDVEVFKEGYLAGPLAEIGATIPVGDPLGYISDTPNDIQIAQDELVSRQVSSDIIPHDAGIPIMMPQLSDTMTQGTIISWEKKVGDSIHRGDIVATVETDKAIMDVEVFQDGILSGPLASIESVINVGHPIGFIVDAQSRVRHDQVKVSSQHKIVEKTEDDPLPNVHAIEEAPASLLQPDQTGIPQTRVKPAARPSNRYVSPYARKLAAQKGVDLNIVSASGPNGVIMATDVIHAQPTMEEVAHQLPQVQVPGNGRPMTAMEKAVAHSMTAALTLPTFHLSVNVHPEKLIQAARASSVSFTIAIAKACSEVMRRHPMVNNAYQPLDKIVERNNHDFGIAVAAEQGGLVVPILRDIQHKTLTQLQKEFDDIVPRARTRKLSPEEYTNPTFTISNLGMFGVSHFTAIPTPGIAAILAIPASGPNGMALDITCDHRVLNGAHAAEFMKDLKQAIEAPETWIATTGSPIPSGNFDYSVVVIGGGPGGEDCARDLADHGIKVAMVNNAPLPGGECLWRGCIPSKTWRAAADRIKDHNNDALLGVITDARSHISWEILENHRKNILNKRGEMAAQTDRGLKIELIQGQAKFIDDHRISITSAEGKISEISFGAAVIATGAPPFIPPIPGAREHLDTGVLTSDTIWSLKTLPKKLGIIGAGAIGVEMAQIFQDLGTQVLLLEANDRPLMEVEEEVAQQLSNILDHEPGLSMVTQAKISQISGKPGKMKIHYQAQGKEHEFSCDFILMATGKRPETGNLDLAKAGVTLDGPAIKTESSGRTSVAHIYAVGDVVGGYMLA
ncbi:MAG: FAD-dependent oxidoreductase, partial [Pseudomonadota bacterium]|nr:FAD-dependent oxidoreductase [Pseudomonadota bacterium]